MPDKQRGLFSRLPDDQGYWLRLTERIVEDGAPYLVEAADKGSEWWSGIARFSTLLAAGAAAAVVAFFLLNPGMSEATSRGAAVDTYGLVPPDPLAITLVSREIPPAVEALITLRNAGSEQ